MSAVIPEKLAELRPIRVAIVDDSVVARALMGRVLEGCDDKMEIVATASNGADGIEMAASHEIDVIVLDLEMPKLGGLKALPQIVEAGMGARVLVVSTLTEDSAPAAVEALLLGATDTLAKPRGGWGHDFRHFSDLLVEKVRSLGECPPVAIEARRKHRLRTSQAAVPHKAMAQARPAAIAIAASTGGPAVLFDLLNRLPTAFSGPVFVTQHLPGAFIPHFAVHLERHCGRRVIVASDGERPLPSTIYLAPGEAHLVLENRGGPLITLSSLPAANGCSPSADPMFDGFGRVYGKTGTAIILSGMGRDGCDGIESVRQGGGHVIAQDQASSVVWGMPGAIVAAGRADAVLSPDDIVAWLISACGAGDVQ